MILIGGNNIPPDFSIINIALKRILESRPFLSFFFFKHILCLTNFKWLKIQSGKSESLKWGYEHLFDSNQFYNSKENLEKGKQRNKQKLSTPHATWLWWRKGGVGCDPMVGQATIIHGSHHPKVHDTWMNTSQMINFHSRIHWAPTCQVMDSSLWGKWWGGKIPTVRTTSFSWFFWDN